MKEQTHSTGVGTSKPADSNQSLEVTENKMSDGSHVGPKPGTEQRDAKDFERTTADAPVAAGLPEAPATSGSAEAPVGSGSTENPEGESKPFDFGGLPARNLKKNLGCG